MINKLEKLPFHVNSIGCTDYQGFTIIELLNEYYRKINEVITLSNDTNKNVNEFKIEIDQFMEWVKTIGLKEETLKLFDEWKNNGTWEQIINEELFKGLNDKVDTEIGKLNSSLETKMNKNGILNMANMGQDVKEAMTGGSVAVVGVNAILTENIVNGQITAEKLASDSVKHVKLTSDCFAGGVISNSSTLDSLAKTGYYIVTDCSQLPNPAGTYLLDLKRSVLGNGRYYIAQEIIDVNTKQEYVRFITEGGTIPNVFFTKKYDIKFADINSNMLSSSIIISDDSTLQTTTKNGTYLVTNCDILPDKTKTYYMFVENYISNGRIFTKQNISLATGEVFTRVLDSNYPSTIKPFSKVGSKQLAEKTIVCFGDSVIEFGDIPKRIGEITGATVYNVGFGGCRMSYNSDVDYNEMSMYKLADTITTKNFVALEQAGENLAAKGDDNRSIIARLKGIDFNNIDIITISYGTNDFSSNVQIGNVDSVDTNTFLGAINYSIKTILQYYPHLKIYLFTPLFRVKYGDSDITQNSNGDYLIDFVNKELEVASVNHVPCKDMYRHCNINKYNSTYYFTDGLHPNSLGNELIGDKYSNFIMSN